MRTRKTLINLFFNFIQQLVGIITNFILPPLLISNFGSSFNGLISTIRQMMTYAQLTGAGISQSSTYALYEPLYKKDYITISGIYNATNKMFVKAGNYFSLIVLLLSLVYPFFVKDIDRMTVIFLVIIIGISGISEFYVYGKYQTIVNANQNNYIIALTQAIGNIANIIITIILIALNANIIIVQLGASIIYLMRIIILKWYVDIHYPYLNNSVKPMFNKITQRNNAIIHQLAGLIVYSSSTIIVSLICGLKSASVYTVYALVFNGLDTICSMISTAVYASFGEIISQREQKLLITNFNLFECIYFCFTAIIYVVTFLMIMPFIDVYTSGMTDTNYHLPILAFLFVLVGIANNIRVPARTLVNAAGHFKQTQNRAIIEMVLCIVGQIIFSFTFGINGVLLGCLMSYSYRTIDFVIYSNKYIVKISSFNSFKRVIIYVLFGILFILCFNKIFVVKTQSYYAWFAWAICITFAVSIYFLFITFIFDKQSIKKSINILRSFFQ
ncbi:polysaccharide biosynthesis protein [Merdibacter massiliensis]|uniref:hypothetical protein n=1 Tax=Merdibacter massiliensis TaxID=1871030 RepID=UPI00096A2971|nr:hypothetical protein [Merdibacter massiliensis]